MAVITTSTFDPLKARVNVRLQQGVPIVDADWNELDDIRKFELRAYLKWYVGDGIPDGSDAFRIDAITPAVTDNFIIRTGIAVPPAGTTNYDQGLRFAGRAIVDGLDVIITADINYKAQPLFTAAAFGVPQIAPLPTAAGLTAVYLDVWERLITSQEDPSLVLSGIGTESCARMKREWCVRTRSTNVVPRPTDSDFIAGHSYYLLAVINRSDPWRQPRAHYSYLRVGPAPPKAIPGIDREPLGFNRATSAYTKIRRLAEPIQPQVGRAGMPVSLSSETTSTWARSPCASAPRRRRLSAHQPPPRSKLGAVHGRRTGQNHGPD